MLEIKNGITIPEERISFRFSRSGGPGGQNVNKVNTRVTVFFDLAGCETLSDAQKARIIKRLATRTDKNGVIRVVCQKYRTQSRNRRTALERLIELLKQSLATKRVRKKTKVPRAAKEKRLAEKKRRGQLKRQRAKIESIED